MDAKSPELVHIQNVLAEKGLKDPWMRNEVWRYNRDLIGPQTWSNRWGRLMFRKFHYGLALALATVGLEMGYAAATGGNDHGHGGHGGHH